MTDAALELPAPPTATPAVDVPDPLLAWAGSARARPFRIAGRRAAALGTEWRGVAATQADGVLLTGPIRLTDSRGRPPAAANVLIAPGLIRRELVAPGTTLSETVIAPGALPGLVVQWRTAGPAVWRGRLEVELPPAPVPPGRHRVRAGTMRVAGAAGDETGCVLHLDAPGPPSGEPDAGWRLAAAGARRATIELALDPGRPLTLLVAAVDAAGRTASLTALAAADAHLRRADHAVGRAPGLRAHTGVPGIDDGLAWARVSLRAAVGRAGPAPVLPPGPATPAAALLLDPAATSAWTLAGALAAGETDAARELLDALGDHPLDAWALTEWVAWTGEGTALLAARSWLAAVLDTVVESGLSALLRDRVADAAEAAGDRRWARSLRAERGGTPARAGRPGGPSARAGDPGEAAASASARGGVRLPSLRPAAGSFAAAALGGDPGGAPVWPDPPDDPSDPMLPLLARARYASGEPDEGFALLRPALGAPVADGPPVGPLAPALVALAFTGGLLGARPDAAFGRLALAPALPASWSRFGASGLRVGDAILDLEYVRDGDRHTWRFRPSGGAVPLMLVLEPALPLAWVASVRVDGRPAGVEATRRGNRRVVRLQFPLDAERSLTVEGAGPASP